MGRSDKHLRPELIEQQSKPRASLRKALPDDGNRHVLVRLFQALIQFQHSRCETWLSSVQDMTGCGASTGMRAGNLPYTFFSRQLMAFPGPCIDVGRAFLPASHFPRERLIQLRSDLIHGFSRRRPSQNICVPDAVQIGSVAFVLRIAQLGQGIEERHWNAVAALIVVRCSVQRLVQIAHEMDQEAQGVRPFLRIGIARSAGLRADR